MLIQNGSITPNYASLRNHLLLLALLLLRQEKFPRRWQRLIRSAGS